MRSCLTQVKARPHKMTPKQLAEARSLWIKVKVLTCLYIIREVIVSVARTNIVYLCIYIVKNKNKEP